MGRQCAYGRGRTERRVAPPQLRRWPLRRTLFGGALLGGLDASVAGILERVGAREFAIGEFEATLRALELGLRGTQLDLIRGRIDLKQEIALVNDRDLDGARGLFGATRTKSSAPRSLPFL
jgi:hypothetical protein